MEESTQVISVQRGEWSQNIHTHVASAQIRTWSIPKAPSVAPKSLPTRFFPRVTTLLTPVTLHDFTCLWTSCKWNEVTSTPLHLSSWIPPVVACGCSLVHWAPVEHPRVGLFHHVIIPVDGHLQSVQVGVIMNSASVSVIVPGSL